MKELKAITFDLDDTLYLERDFVKSGFHAVSQWLTIYHKLNSENVFDVLWDMFCSGRRGDLFDGLIESFAYLEISVNDLISVYRQHSPNIKPFDGIEPLLKSLRNGKKVGLLTDGFLDVQKNKLNALGLTEYFDVVVFSDDLGRDYWKPNTVPFEMLIQQLNVKSNETIYVVDNPEKDFKGPNELGMNTIRIRLEHGEHFSKEPQSSEYAPMQTVYSIKELSKELGKSI